jgi:chloride channel 3/4/5
MIAAGTLRFLDPFGTGKLVLFQVTYDKVSHSPHSTTLLPNNPFI